jgi:peptide/nickel transport system permease protein
MIRYIAHRVLMIIPILVGVIVVVFTINYFSSGSAAISVLGSSATPEKIAALEHEWGLDRPYIVQLGDYFWTLISSGSFGRSIVFNVPVNSLIASRILPTVIIGFISIGIAIVIGIPLGIVAATHQFKALDYCPTLAAVVVQAIPNFWLAYMLMLVFAVKFGIFPVSGYASWECYILPVLSCGLAPLSSVLRMTRSSMLETIRQDYIRTAKSKGISNRRVLFRHALKNSLIPVITTIGGELGVAIAGAIIIENVFAIPGLGVLMFNSINSKDFMTLQGAIIVCALLVIIANLLADIAYAFVDPRIKAQYEEMSRIGREKKEARKLAEVQRGVDAL